VKDAGCVHVAQKVRRLLRVLGQDRLGVPAAILMYVGDRGRRILHHLHRRRQCAVLVVQGRAERQLLSHQPTRPQAYPNNARAVRVMWS
jgi:hypothetical protein